MFELGTIDDLILPRPRSSTGRALASMSLRRTFEACKALRASSRGAAAADAIRSLGLAFDARLPGDPHGIAHAIADPAIGVPLRAGLADDSLLPEAIDRLLVRLGDRAGVVPGTESAVHGRIRVREGDATLERSVGVEASRDVPIGTLREAIEQLHRRAPAMHADLPRFAAVLLVTEAWDTAIAPTAIGVGTVPPEGDVGVHVAALIRSLVRGRILALVEGRTHDPDAREILIEDAGAAAIATIVGAIVRVPRRSVHLGEDDPLRFVAAELDRL